MPLQRSKTSQRLHSLDFKMSSLEALKVKLQQVINQEIPLKEVGVKSQKATFRQLPDISLRSLKAEHFRLSLFAAMAKEVGLSSLSETAKLALEYLHVLGKRFHNYDFPEMVVSEENIAETALSIINKVENSVTFKQSLEMARLRDTEGGATTSHVTPGDDVQHLEQDPPDTSHGQLQQQVPIVTTDEQVHQDRTAYLAAILHKGLKIGGCYIPAI